MLSPGVLSAVVQVVIALIASGVAVKLLTIRQDRRKIAGEASTSEANAASTLSGAALQMVEAANTNARNADTRAAAAETSSAASKKEAEKLWLQLNNARWEIYYLKGEQAVLEAALRKAGIEVHSIPRPENGFPDFPPPEQPSQWGIPQRPAAPSPPPTPGEDPAGQAPDNN